MSTSIGAASAAALAAGVLHLATPEQTAALQRQKDLDDLNGRQLDKAPPGGRFVGTDGRYHDSYGRPLTEDGSVVVTGSAMAGIIAGTPEHLDALALARSRNDAEPSIVNAPHSAENVARTEFTGESEPSAQTLQAANLPGDPPGVPLPKTIQDQIEVRPYAERPRNELELLVAQRGIRGIKGTGEKKQGSSKATVTNEDIVKALEAYDKKASAK